MVKWRAWNFLINFCFQVYLPKISCNLRMTSIFGKLLVCVCFSPAMSTSSSIIDKKYRRLKCPQCVFFIQRSWLFIFIFNYGRCFLILSLLFLSIFIICFYFDMQIFSWSCVLSCCWSISVVLLIVVVVVVVAIWLCKRQFFYIRLMMTKWQERIASKFVALHTAQLFGWWSESSRAQGRQLRPFRCDSGTSIILAVIIIIIV